jgi:holo-[acyl-carrier protein] synthase
VIIGIGSDICDIRRIEATLARYGERFTARIFTAHERARAESRPGAAATYARRFAAKEACAKALGTGLRGGVFWRDMEVVNLPSGQPTLKLAGGALARLAALTPAGMASAISLTMTDEYPYAQAVVVISLSPASLGPALAGFGASAPVA